MPAWLSVYCKQSVGHLTPQELLERISVADFWTLAEWYDLPEEQVDPARKQLRVESTGEEGFDVYELNYRAPGHRPVFIRRWAAPALVQEEIGEALGKLQTFRSPAANRVREDVRQASEVIGIELGWSQLEDMGIAFAYEVARTVAQVGQGVIAGLDEGWMTVDDRGGFVDLLRRSE
jgi:hypothetical protein